MSTQPCSTCHGEGRILASLHSNDPHPRDEGPCPDCNGRGSNPVGLFRTRRNMMRAPTDALIDEALENIKKRLESNLNNHLCEMKPGYDDSIVGFNEAWDVMRKVFADTWTKNALKTTLAKAEGRS